MSADTCIAPMRCSALDSCKSKDRPQRASRPLLLQEQRRMNDRLQKYGLSPIGSPAAGGVLTMIFMVWVPFRMNTIYFKHLYYCADLRQCSLSADHYLYDSILGIMLS